MEIDERVRQKIRHLAPLDGCACNEEWVYGGQLRAIISWAGTNEENYPWIIFVTPLELQIWTCAGARWKQQNDLCAQRRVGSAWTSTWSDQSLLSHWRTFWSIAVHKVHREDWSNWVDAQAELSLRWAHRSFCWFCHAPAQLPFVFVVVCC